MSFRECIELIKADLSMFPYRGKWGGKIFPC